VTLYRSTFPRWFITLLGGLLCFVFLSMGEGVPDFLSDEPTNVWDALRIASGQGIPQIYLYKIFYLNLVAFGAGIVYLGGWLVGTWGSVSGYIDHLACSTDSIRWVARSVSALAATITIPLLDRLVRQLTSVPQSSSSSNPLSVAPLSALFLAIMPINIFAAHQGKEDSLLALFVVAATIEFVRFYQTGDRRQAILSGVWMGLAIAAKYVAIFLLPGFLLAWIGRFYVSPADRVAMQKQLITLCLAGFAAIFAFAAVVPNLLPHLDAMIADFRQMTSARIGSTDLADIGLVYHFKLSFPVGVGIPLSLLSLIGLLLTFKKPRWIDLIVYAYPLLLFFVGLAWSRQHYPTYLVSITPFLAIAVAQTVDWLFHLPTQDPAKLPADQGRRLTTHLRRQFQRPFVAIFVMILIASPSMGWVIRFFTIVGRDDTRRLATRWIETHVPDDVTILSQGSSTSFQGVLPLRKTDDQLVEERSRAKNNGLTGGRFDIQRRCNMLPRYRVIYSAPTESATTPELHRTDLSCDALRQAGVSLLIASTHPLYDHAAGIPKETLHCLDPLRSFEPYTSRTAWENATYIDGTTFFFPFGRFANITRPGPAITIYRLKP